MASRTSHGESHRAGVSYLFRRGIDIRALEKVTQRWEVGHALDGVHSVTAALRADGFADNELIDAGLSRRSWQGPGLVDVYRHRVLVPIRTAKDDVCALVGRNVGDPHAPKYLNPPRTAIYDKSTNLYHPLPAPGHRHCRAVIVEGTLDAIARATAIIRAGLTGRLWPVTQSGRELSDRQVNRILSVSAEPPLLALDADHAGREAAARLASAFAARGVAPAHAYMYAGRSQPSLVALRCGLFAERR